MSELRQADARVKAGRMRVKADHLREAMPGRCARQGLADARGKAGRIREARQGRCAMQGWADALGNSRQML
jgi:hypothetical protein